MRLQVNLTPSISASRSSPSPLTSSSLGNLQVDLLPFYGLTTSQNVHPNPAKFGQFQTQAFSSMRSTSTPKLELTSKYSKTLCLFPTNKSTLQLQSAQLQTNNRNGSACSLNTTMRSLKYPYSQLNLSTIHGLSIISQVLGVGLPVLQLAAVLPKWPTSTNIDETLRLFQS